MHTLSIIEVIKLGSMATGRAGLRTSSRLTSEARRFHTPDAHAQST